MILFIFQLLDLVRVSFYKKEKCMDFGQILSSRQKTGPIPESRASHLYLPVVLVRESLTSRNEPFYRYFLVKLKADCYHRFLPFLCSSPTHGGIERTLLSFSSLLPHRSLHFPLSSDSKGCQRTKTIAFYPENLGNSLLGNIHRSHWQT